MIGEGLAQSFRDARTVTVLTGAGISTESGIPDFRGPQGVWTKDPKAAAMATIDMYLGDPDVRKSTWRSRRDHPAWGAEPNAGHRALVDLEKAGRLCAIITQNGLCLEAVEHGARLVVINAQETPYDRLAEAVIREPIGHVLPTLLSGAR